MKASKLGFELHGGDVDITLPLLYRIWVIDNVTGEKRAIYIGQSKSAKRPFMRYDLNIRRMRDGLPPLNGREYRPIHYQLRDAYLAKNKVVIELVRNVGMDEDILEAELALERAHSLPGTVNSLDVCQ